MHDFSDICKEILKAKQSILRSEAQGDFIKFTKHVQRRNLENAEYELKERLREVLRTEGKERFNEAVATCQKFMQDTEKVEENKAIEISYFRSAKDTTPTTVYCRSSFFLPNIGKLSKIID